MAYNYAMKECSKCKVVKEYSEFNKRAKAADGLHVWCRDCSKADYQANKDRHMASVRKNEKKYRTSARTLMAEAMLTGCIDCGNLDLRVLEFDHVRGEKVNGIGEMIRRTMSLLKIKDEIAKCEVRCRNCHAIKTYERLGKTWHDEFMSP